MPLPTPAIPCSRTPKWIWRPRWWRGSKTSASATWVPVLPVRSAPPPTNPGTTSLIASSTLLQAWRVASDSPAPTTAASPPSPGGPALQAGVEVVDQCRLGGAEGVASRLPLAPGRVAAAARRAVEREHVVGDVERLVGGEAQICLTAATSSAPSGLPCASGVSVNRGDGQPMWLRSTRGWAARSRPLPPAARPRSRRGRWPLPQLDHVPPVGLEAAGGVVAQGELGGAVDGDVVVVVDGDQPPEAEVARQRRRLVADASIRSPSEQTAKTWWSVSDGPKRARRLASATARPTALEMP